MLDDSDIDAAIPQNDGEEGDNVATLVLTRLPAPSLQGLWENLVYEAGLKEKILQYSSTLLTMGRFGINSSIISFNKVPRQFDPADSCSLSPSLIACSPLIPHANAHSESMSPGSHFRSIDVDVFVLSR